MRKFIKTLLLSALMAVPLVTNAQSASSLTVADGTSTNSYVPFYGYYMDADEQTQIIYYDSLLTNMRGNYIHKLTMYTSTSSVSYTSTMTVSMGITTANSLGTTFDTTALSTVWTGQIVVANGLLELELDSTFEYPTDGGNLLVQFQQTTGGNYANCTFYGVAASGNGLNVYYTSWNSPALQNFMPKTTFTYSANTTYCHGVQDLIASPVSDVSGTASWTPNGTATTWNVYISDSVITDFTNIAGTSTTDSFYTFTGLTANTSYYVYVQSDCGTDGTSPWVGPAGFTTMCDGTALPVPQMYDFENVASGALPQCWTAVMSGSSSSSTFPSVYSYSYNAHGGNNYLEFESSTGQEEILRMANYDATNSLMLSFYAMYYGSYSPQSFIVGYYGSDTTFMPVDTVSLTGGYSSSYYPSLPIEVSFADVTETTFAPAIRVVGSGTSQYTVFVDDLQVKEIPACAAPYNFHALNVAGTELDLQWTDSTSASSWIVAYDTVPITDFDNIENSITTSDDSITISNLDYNTMYYFYLQSECANGGNSEWVGPIAVATQACDNGCYYHVSLVDSYGDGWNGGYLSYTLNGVLQGSTYTIASGSSYNDSLYICPGMTLGLIYTAGSYSSENSFTLSNMMNEPLYSCSDGSTLTSGSACYTAPTSCSSSCPSVNQLTVTTINPTSLEISWNERGDATQWNVVYDTVPITDFSTYTFDVATSTTYTINNLDTLTYYYIYVQADCGSDSSIWTMLEARTSLCEGACELTVECTGNYWQYGYGSIDVIQNGYLLETLTGTSNVVVCPGDSVYFVYSCLYSYYDNYLSWTVYDRFQNPLTSTLTGVYDTISVYTDCQAPSCARPLQFAFAGTTSGTQSLTWTEMGDATSWNVAYGTEPMDSTASNMTIVAVTDTNFVTITGLSDDTLYYYYVQADCGGDESDWTGPISGYPNTYNMVANATTSITLCGGHIYDDGGADGDYSNSQNSYLTIYPTDSTMGVSVNGTQWTESGSWDWLTIYDGTSNAGTVLFTSQGAASSYSNGLAVSAFSLSGPLTIYFKSDGSGAYAGFDLAVSCFDMSCPAVDSLQVSAVTDSSISLSWVGSENASSYIVKWDTASFSFESTTVDSMIVTADSIDITGLNANAMYYFAVATDCGTSVSNAMFVNQRTACGELALPYNEGFESYTSNSFPFCWTNYQGTSYVSSYSYYSHTGNNSLQFIGNGIIISPRVSLPGNQIQLSCALRAESTTSSGTMHIGFTTDPVSMSDYVEIQTIQPVTSYVNYDDIIFDSASADTGYVVFKQDPSASSYYYWWLDDVVIEPVPACPSVSNVTATAIDTTSISLSWTERGSATSWTVEYGLHGFTIGTGTLSTVTDTTFTATGLNPGTDYDFNIKPVCSDSIPDNIFTFSTYTLPIAVPFFFDFSDTTQATSWTRENGANGWYIGELDGDTSLFVSNDGVTNSYNASSASISLAYVDVMLAANEYSYSFNWLANGESNYDFVRVALIPQGTDLSGLTYSSVGTTTLPTGWIALDGGNKLNQQSSWQSYGGEVLVPSAAGYHIAFIWRNDGSVGNNPAGAIDNFSFQVNSCPVVANVHATNSGTTEIEIDWTDVASTSLGWEIEYGEAGHNFGTGTVLSATAHPFLLSGLDSNTNYDIYVRTICAAGDTSRWSDVATLGTTFCDDATIVSTGAATGTSNNVPVNNYFEYSLTQTIISAEELEDVSEISAISYLLTGSNASSGMDPVTIWLQPSGKTEFTSATDMVTLDTNIAVQVYSGEFNCNPGWNTFMFDNPFTWTGDSASLLVIVDNNTGDYYSNYYYGTVADTLYRTISWYGDNNNPDPLDPGSWTGYSQFYYMARPAMQLVSCGGGSCRKPSGLNAINVDYGNATITWSAVGTDYEIAVKAETDGVWPEATAITVSGTNASYQLTGLSANTTYQYRVRQVCDATTGEISDWSTSSFTTAELPCFAPEGYSVTATTISEATISWPEATDATSFEIHVWNTVYDSVYAVNGTPATIGGLDQTITYNAAVRSVCGYGAEMSEYGDTIQFTTLTCETPTDAAASNVTNSSATISWNGDADTYILEYGMGAFGEGQGTTVEVNSTSYTITGLEPETQYSALVRAKCDAANLSGWSTRVVFTTDGEGIDAVNGLNVNIYPNPTSASTTITLSGVNGEVSISVVDMNGRTVRNATMNCEGDCAHQLEVSNLASGAYFVRISGEGVNSVKRLVVK